jgi:xanthine dehydrogenase YagT iron-sulfur-binding subunit
MPEELVHVVLRVNGDIHSVTIEPRVSLLDALRDHLRLTGTKKGCDQGAVRRGTDAALCGFP